MTPDRGTSSTVRGDQPESPAGVREDGSDAPTISVVIATHNRVELLRGALASLAAQTLAPDRFEILVVASSCTDATVQVVDAFAAEHPHLRVNAVEESRPGAGTARNAGIARSRGPYVAFLDDDARAAPGWLEAALRCFETVQPPPLVVGGPHRPFYLTQKPAWFEDAYESRTWGDAPCFLEHGVSFSASNMIAARDVFRLVGLFNTVAGPKGDAIGMCDETPLFEAIWRNDPAARLYYDPAVEIEHFVPALKMTVPYALRRAWASGESWVVAHPSRTWRTRVGNARRDLALALRLLASGLRAHREYADRRKWAYERVAPVVMHLAMCSASLGVSIRMRRH